MDTNEMIALLLPPNGCFACSDTRKEIAEELARRSVDLERECADADKICAALGLTVDKSRTEGGSLNVPRIVGHIQETLTALRESHAFGVAMSDKYVASRAPERAAAQEPALRKPQPECSPTMTVCPRCQNDIARCDGLQPDSSTAANAAQQEQHDDNESDGGRTRRMAGEGNADQLRHDGREGAVGRSGAAEHDAGFLRPQQHADSGRGNAPRFLIDNDTLRKQIAADPDDEPSAGSLPPPEATRHPCGHLMVSDACVVCDSPAACKAHESCCRHDEPQIAPAEQPVRDAYTLPAPDVAALVERLCAWQAKITELRTALAGATAIANSAGATIRTLTKERDRAREALRDTLAWLDDPRMDTWPYMENGPFHDDRRVHQDKLRAALAEGKE